MITELLPLLITHKVAIELERIDDKLWIYVIPTIISENKERDANTKKVLNHICTKKYEIDGLTNDVVLKDILSFNDTMVEGTTNILSIEEEFKALAAKKTKGKKTTTRKAPPRKTKAQKEAEEKEKARNEQEKARKDEPPPKEDGDRLETKPKEEKPDEDDPLGLGLGELDI